MLAALAFAIALIVPYGSAAAPVQPGQLVFVKEGALYLWNPDSGDTKPVAIGKQRVVGDVSLSPDGQQIAYTAVARGGIGADIWVVNGDSTGNRLATPWPSATSKTHLHAHSDPGWVDAHTLVFSDLDGPTSVDLRSGKHAVVARPGIRYEGLVVSGQIWAYAARVPARPGCLSQTDLFLQRGPAPTQELTHTPGSFETPLDLLAGRPVLGVARVPVAASHKGHCLSKVYRSVVQLRAYMPGKGSLLLIRLAPAPALGYPVDAAWSPDGQEFAYLSGPDGDLIVHDLATSSDTPVASGVTALDW